MASDEWRKQLNLSSEPAFKVQCSKFKVGDAAVER
jgi:hypothetical protein